MKRYLYYMCLVGTLLNALVGRTAAQAQDGVGRSAVSRALKTLGAQEDTIALNGLYENLEPATQIAPSLLGIGAQNVSAPGGIQDISLSVLQSFVNLPSQGSGVGLEFSPVQLLEKTTYHPTKRDSNIARILGFSPLRRDSVAFRSLTEYRRTYWQRGFTVSAASVGDSLASRVAAGISYTFGAGQLDPFVNKGYSEMLTRDINTVLVNGVINEFLTLNKEYIDKKGEALITAMQVAGIKPRTSASPGTFAVPGEYAEFLSFITDQILAFPQINSTDTTDEQRARIVQLYIPNTLRDNLKRYLSTRPELTEAQREQFAASLEKNLFEELQQSLTAYQVAVTPLFRNVGNLLQAASREFERRNWNAPLLQIGTGQVWRSADRSWDGLARQSFHGFVRGSVRPSSSSTNPLWQILSRHTQLIGNLQYVYQDSDSLKQQLGYGLRLLAGNERLRFSAEGYWRHQRYRAVEGQTQDPNTIRRYTLGLEVRMADNLWLEVAVGRTNAAAVPGQVTDKSSILTLADLKYGFRNRRRFAVR